MDVFNFLNQCSYQKWLFILLSWFLWDVYFHITSCSSLIFSNHILKHTIVEVLNVIKTRSMSIYNFSREPKSKELFELFSFWYTLLWEKNKYWCFKNYVLEYLLWRHIKKNRKIQKTINLVQLWSCCLDEPCNRIFHHSI